uniref:Uncharacterized protein n=1 Tax=Magallana gigas TaxID=29159 RepID=A0A8W8M1G7_MAGGI
MVSLSGHSVCHLYAVTVWFCLLSVSQAKYGHLCKTPCQRGFFGENCLGKCLNNCAGCNSVTGLCEYGCLKGYTGYFCENETDHIVVIKCADNE